ncbi:long-chain fatty acid transporter [Agarivorans sp. Toyoura001]|uniref:OmpP1/FadL family transporter n=1 Tax=Agarivorans sp. Toyoura001 TaxID=2283141 RepID=UPI0010D2AD00|nr:outer membrane protein transport protein [Agarivorans sp. Toyoura001]GDY24962.1 long-chain fatty acid transporter [Agarivorans sp. Toyoura001]
MLTMIRAILCGVLLASFSSYLFAGGYHLPQASYANLGTAGAGDGVYRESSAAIWANPAIMSFMDRDIFTVNGLALNLSNTYYDHEDSDDNSRDSGGWLGAAGLFYNKTLNENWAAGVAFTTIGGAALDYGSGWKGSTQVVDTSLVTLQLNPSLSYKLNDKLSIAAGIQANYASIDMSSQLLGQPLSMTPTDDWAFGYNLGLVYQFNQDTIAGISYRSKLEHQFNDNVSYLNQNADYSMAIDAVAFARADVSHQLNQDWRLFSTLSWYQWSDFKSTELIIASSDQSITRNWQDTWAMAVGTDYQINQDWRIKFGFSYETSPLDDAQYQAPDLPVDRQIRYSVGLSTMINEVPVDFFYEYSDLGSPEVNQNQQVLPSKNLVGHFDMDMHFLGFAVSF